MDFYQVYLKPNKRNKCFSSKCPGNYAFDLTKCSCFNKVPQRYFAVLLVKITKCGIPFVNLRIYKRFHIDRNLFCGINVNEADPSIPPLCHIFVLDYY